MSDGPHFVLQEDLAMRIIDSAQQMIKVTDREGKWTGQTINKAHIISTDRDRDAERDWHRSNARQLPEGKEIITPEQQKRMEKKRKEISDMMRSWKGKPAKINILKK